MGDKGDNVGPNSLEVEEIKNKKSISKSLMPGSSRTRARSSSLTPGGDAGRVTRAERQIGERRGLVATAAAAFESRWTLSALGRYNARWLRRLEELRGAWWDVDGTD